MSKITAWSKSKTISVNKEKSEVILISRSNRKEVKEIKVYLLNKPLEQVTKMEYLGIIIDNKCKFSEYTECPRRNVIDFGRVFLMLKYTEITQNT